MLISLLRISVYFQFIVLLFRCPVHYWDINKKYYGSYKMSLNIDFLLVLFRVLLFVKFSFQTFTCFVIQTIPANRENYENFIDSELGEHFSPSVSVENYNKVEHTKHSFVHSCQQIIDSIEVKIYFNPIELFGKIQQFYGCVREHVRQSINDCRRTFPFNNLFEKFHFCLESSEENSTLGVNFDCHSTINAG